MRLIIEYAVAGWLSFNVLFVIAWARVHAARRRYEDQSKATVIVFRPNDNSVRSEIANYAHLADDASEVSLKKTS